MGVYLRLETFAGGTPEDALAAALGCAHKTGVWVKIDLNGVTVLIHPLDKVEVLAAQWRKAMERGVTFVSSNVCPNR